MVTKTLLETIFPGVIVENFDLDRSSIIHRRKWLDTETNEILTKTYSIAFEGTQLTKEFVSFF